METQILNEILTNLKTLNSTVHELKEGQARLEAKVDHLEQEVGDLKQDVGILKEDVGGLKEDVGGLKQDVKILNLKVNKLNLKVDKLDSKVDHLDSRVYSLEKVTLGLRDDVNTIHIVSSRTEKFIEKHFSEEELNSIVVDF